jgi:hypothetical protein
MRPEDSELLKVIAEKIITAEDIGKIDLGINIGTMRWTGWRDTYWTDVKHGQLILYKAAGTKTCYYADIPSMKHGPFELGSAFNIECVQDVSKPMYPGNVTLQDAREWFKEALMLLIDDVLTAHPEILNEPYREVKNAVSLSSNAGV